MSTRAGRLTQHKIEKNAKVSVSVGRFGSSAWGEQRTEPKSSKLRRWKLPELFFSCLALWLNTTIPRIFLLVSLHPYISFPIGRTTGLMMDELIDLSSDIASSRTSSPIYFSSSSEENEGSDEESFKDAMKMRKKRPSETDLNEATLESNNNNHARKSAKYWEKDSSGVRRSASWWAKSTRWKDKSSSSPSSENNNTVRILEPRTSSEWSDIENHVIMEWVSKIVFVTIEYFIEGIICKIPFLALAFIKEKPRAKMQLQG